MFSHSVVSLCNTTDCRMPGLAVLHHLPEFAENHESIESVMPSNHLTLCRPLLLPPILLSIRVLSNVLTLHIRWPKYWSFSFSIIPSKEIPGLISFRMDWLDLLAVQEDSQESSPTPQFKSINSSVLSLRHSPALTSIYDYWKNHGSDWTDLCRQSNVSAF